MRRVVSLWLPTWPTDRLRKSGADLPEAGPLVTAMHDGRRLAIAATDTAAAGFGLYADMVLAQAQALVPGLTIRQAEPAADVEALRRLAGWCLRYAPLVSADPPDGIWLEVTGCAHLLGGETALLRDLLGRLASQGITARAAVADTPGAAFAVAHFGNQDITVVPLGGTKAALAELPIEALRLAPEIADGLHRLGFDRIAQLIATPRAPLTRRFGSSITLRLDQALGTVFEPIVPVFPPELPQASLAFVEPLLTVEAFTAVIAQLTGTVCTALENCGQGARRIDLLFERVDGSIQVLRIGTARPSRDPRHLARLLTERLERVDPGLGVETMRLVIPATEQLAYVQTTASDASGTDLSGLVDVLANRLGAERIYSISPVESDVPERSVEITMGLPPLPQEEGGNGWANLPRPVRLLEPPQPVEAMALLPDHPPVAFTWRRVRHRVRRADGPERIAGEWWRYDSEFSSIRDYFRVEDEHGRRFWLFRRGNGEDLATGDMRWFLHGLF